MKKYQLFSEHNNITVYGEDINDAINRANPLPQSDEHLRDDNGNWMPKYKPRPPLQIKKILGELPERAGTRGGNKNHKSLLVELEDGKYYELDYLDYNNDVKINN